MSTGQSQVIQKIRRAADVIRSLERQAPAIAQEAQRLREALLAGRRVLTCGNGGSAAEALHLAEELIGKYRANRRPFPAVCLNADPTAITCIANDYGYNSIFSRQVEALAAPGDILVAFSTSGNSQNITTALHTARARGARTVGLLGKSGGAAAPLCDAAIIVDAQETEHIQEAHQVILHLFLEAVETPE
ncbi:MAG: SIS domain-containing protein [Planctomycetota bacterium]|nr:SIS domain-containing protein [Planctomycetota bacterium]